jgi:intergrase/recombinase
MKEIDEAAKAGLDLDKLNRELEGLRIESSQLKRKIDEERESLDARAKMKKVLSALIQAVTLSSLVNGIVSDSPNYCGLSAEDMEAYVSEIDRIILYSQITKKAFRGFIEKLGERGVLRVVQND